MGGQPFGRIGVLPLAERRTGVLPALLVIVVITSLVATCAGPTPSPSPGVTPAVPASPSASPGASASPGITPLPSTPPSGWARLQLPAEARVATLTATRAGASGVALTTAFRLTSLDGSPVRELAARLSVTPAVKLAVARVTGSMAELRPSAPLRERQVYRFELRRADGTTAAAWAVQSAWPLRLASSVPGDEATGVPRDTGIEVTFDQAGVRLADVRDHFSISPKVAGRFEQHGDTFVFVPLKPLAARTLYTVTIRHGLPLPGTGMTLAADEVIRFETTGGKVSPVHVTMQRPLFDASTAERAALSVNLDSESEDEAPITISQLQVAVHRLPGLAAAMDAYERIRVAPDWVQRSSTTPVATASLPRVLEGKLALRKFDEWDDYARWFRLPSRLPAGWYVVTVTHAGISRQAVLQVTDLAAFTTITRTRSLVWVNDLRANGAVGGARVTLAGKDLGRTDGKGLVVARTPATLPDESADAGPSYVVVRSGSRAAFLPVTESGVCYSCASGDTEGWWHLLTTDRTQYRATDTVNVWGVLRNRDTGKVPASVSVRLAANATYGVDQPPVASVTATPDRSGAWLASLPFSDLPAGEYVVSVHVGSTSIGEAWVRVGPIAKPAWQVSVSASKHAVLSGTPLPVTIAATFFEGTPVAGTTLQVGGDDEYEEEDASPTPVIATTDSNGQATAIPVVRLSNDEEEQWSELLVRAWPDNPEEGDISGAVRVAVFRSSALLDLAPTVEGTTLTVKGSVHDVAFERFESPDTPPGAIDPRGDPRPGARVTVEVTQVTPVVRQTGTRYDFIAKRAVPVYKTTERRATLDPRTVVTASDGSFRLTMDVKGGDRWYEVRATYTDEGARRIAASGTAWQGSEPGSNRAPWLSAQGSTDSWGEYSVGDTVRVTFREGIASPEVSRYLFAVMARGLRSVSVQGSARFTTRFTAGLVPAATITGVRFTGTGYEVAGGFDAALRQDDRRLDVQLTADQERYTPGDRATVAIRTLDATGHPVSASVFVRAVDEKLYAIAAAEVSDPLSDLYQDPGGGILATAWTHLPPSPYGDGKDTTGGGGDGRNDFRDWLVARLVTTDAAGRGSVSFDLSDDLTSWRVVASGVTPGLQAGQGSLLLPVSLPFFADAVFASEYLVVDAPVIRVRAYGTALTTADDVTFTVSSDTLPLTPVTVQGKAFQPSEVTLPQLGVGTHRVRIEASTGSGAARRTDTLIRTFTVVETRTVRTHTASVPLVAGTTVGGGSGLTSVTLVDAGRGRVVPLLRELVASDAARADQLLAAAIAGDVLADQFGIPADPRYGEPDLTAFQDESGIRIVPYASADLELTAMAALSGDRHLSREQLAYAIHNSEDEQQPTGRALYLLLGRAALGEPVLGEVAAAAARTDLTPSQRVTVALAAVAAGDDALARQIEGDLLASYGERLGSWVRLNVGSSEQTAVATARLAIVAAALGDPVAADMDAEVAAHPPVDTVVDLERAIAASYWARRVPNATAVAAVTLDGKRTERTVTSDEPVTFDVTPAQREGLRIDPVSGSVLVVSQWDGPVAAGDLVPPAGMSVTRSITPSGAIGATDLVSVTFEVNLGPQAEGGCWQLTDFAPSGLVALTAEQTWRGDDEEDTGPFVLTPWRVVGQRVDFCVVPDARHPVQTLHYLARVVSAGTYRWEPAVLQSSVVPERGVVMPSFDLTIRGLAS